MSVVLKKLDQPYKKEQLISFLSPRFPWIREWKINVSVGITSVVGALLDDIDEILDSTSQIDFMRIIEHKIDDEMYLREIIVFIETVSCNDAQKTALSYSVRRATHLSKALCFKCGSDLYFMKVDEDELVSHPALNELKSGEFYDGTINLCMQCFGREGGRLRQGKVKREKEVLEKIDLGIVENNKENINIANVDEKPKSIKNEPTSKSEDEVIEDNSLSIMVFDLSEVDKLKEAYEHASRDQTNRVRGLVKQIRKVTPEKNVIFIPEKWREHCLLLSQQFPNFEEVVSFIQNQLSLSEVGNKMFKLPPLLFAGEPGVGKNEFMLSASQLFNTKLDVLDMASAQTGSALSGSENYWGNTQPGLLFKTLVLGEIANPFIMLDEIDKTRRDEAYRPLSSLHQLLEPRQAKIFHDLSVPELTIDASHINWIATANELELIEKPILDRFTVFTIEKPTPEQMQVIVKNQYERFIENHSSGRFFEKEVSEKVIVELCRYHPRQVRKLLENAFGFAAYDERNFLIAADIKINRMVKQYNGIGFLSGI